MDENKNINKDSWDLIDYCNSYSIENEFFFEDFEEVLLPGLPAKVGGRVAFTSYRNRLKNNPKLPENRVKIEGLQRLNNVVTLQEQKRRAVALKNELYDYKTKVDESLAEFQNQLYDINIELSTNQDELEAKLDLILNNLNDIGVIIQEIESDKNILKKILKEINLKLDNIIDLSKVLQQNIKDEFSYLLEQVKSLFNELTNLIKNNFKILNDLITEKFLSLTLDVDTSISIANSTNILLNKFFEEFKLFDLNKLKDLLINIKNIIVETTTNCKNQVITNSDEAHIVTRTSFTSELGGASATIIGAVELGTSTVTSQLGVEIAAVSLLIEDTYTLIIDALNEGFTTVRKQISNLETLIVNNFNVIEKELRFFIKNFKSNITEVLNDWYKKNNKNIIEKITNFICELIVGESYIKYDANYMYMPTIILRYKTKNIEDERKYSQIKLRLNYKTEDITDSLINNLKLKI